MCFLSVRAETAAGVTIDPRKHYQILQEERFLLNHYGEAYRRCQQAVPRYMGVVCDMDSKRKGNPDETFSA